MKNNTYLFVSILALVGGLILIAFGRADIFSIGLTLMGIVGTLAGLFLLISPENKKESKTKEQAKPSTAQTISPHVCDHSHCVEKLDRPRLIDNKVVCKYCKCKFAKTLDKCPYCGAPQNN